MSQPAAINDERRITLKEVKANSKVRKLIDGANEVMRSMGYTEHGHRHVGVVSSITKYLLEQIGETPRQVELGMIKTNPICRLVK